jgi:glutathione S-transferase
MDIVIGTRKWSTWSLRPWLALKRAGAEFTETLVTLREVGVSEAIAKYSPSGRVPALRDGELLIWDSLAICEYLAETFPEAKLWPDDAAARALGRSAVAEMHSGFASLRGECPMDLTAAPTHIELSEATAADVRRIVRLWSDLRGRFAAGGPFLLGAWSIADAFYAPVASRFRTYGIRLSDYGDSGPAGAYAETILETPEFLEWEAAARAE